MVPKFEIHSRAGNEQDINIVCDEPCIIYLMFKVDLPTYPSILVALLHRWSTCLDQVRVEDVKTPRSRLQSVHSKMVSLSSYG